MKEVADTESVTNSDPHEKSQAETIKEIQKAMGRYNRQPNEVNNIGSVIIEDPDEDRGTFYGSFKIIRERSSERFSIEGRPKTKFDAQST